jgi:hypothetical protein
MADGMGSGQVSSVRNTYWCTYIQKEHILTQGLERELVVVTDNGIRGQPACPEE